MAIYALSDLHLSFGTNKPMNVFGRNWNNYEEKIRENWNSMINDEDFVLICGDISWGTYIEDCVKDFEYISNLKGTKIISKGNHDYWWCTQKKQQEFLAEHGFKNIQFLHNNSYALGGGAHVCGARGWVTSQQSAEDKKIYERELQRLELSIKSVPRGAEKIIAMLHYPPDMAIMEMFERHGISECIYGHLHAGSQKNAVFGTLNGVRYNLTACDYLGFKPIQIA